jgi:hypothetical protein
MRHPKLSILLAWAICRLAWAVPAHAQSCPSQYTACDNGGCCLSSEQCCPGIEDGCCSSATPFCCPGGGCAATPSQCETAALTACDGYDVPCGNGCAPAGSDCCDLAGHYCGPESMCTSDTSCVLGDVPSLALQVTATPRPEEEPSGPKVDAPYADPPSASDRSCDMGSGSGAPNKGGSTLVGLTSLLGVALVVRRRAPRSSPGQSGSSR